MDWVTTTLVLERLEREEDGAWESFVERFRQPVIRFARNLGLPPDEAEDVAQETLIAFLGAYRAGRYDRARGRLGSWLFGFAHRNALKARGRRAREHRRAASGRRTGFWNQVMNEEDARQTWDRAWDLTLLEQCLQQVRIEIEPTTLRAFEAVAIRRRRPADVARELGVSRNAVFIAKHRVLKRLRTLREQIEQIEQID